MTFSQLWICAVLHVHTVWSLKASSFICWEYSQKIELSNRKQTDKEQKQQQSSCQYLDTFVYSLKWNTAVPWACRVQSVDPKPYQSFQRINEKSCFQMLCWFLYRILKKSFVNDKLVNWCFEPSQPLRITSGLKETFIKRHNIVERTNKAEITLEEQSEKTESCRENSWNEIQLKRPYKDRNRRKNRIKRSGQVQLVYVTDINRNIPTTRR